MAGAAASGEDPAAPAVKAAGAQAQPANPVRLFAHGEDPCVRRLHVRSLDEEGLLFRLCELLTSHGIDIVSAEVSTEDGVVNNRFELHISRPADLDDATELCKEIEDFLARNNASVGGAPEALPQASKRLSVNSDLLSVVTFHQILEHDGPRDTKRYCLELEGINQAGLLTYTALVLYRSGFSIVHATISTHEGHVSDTFELSATTAEAEHLLRQFLDVPFTERQQESVPLPFHVSPSDCNMEELMRMWGKHPLLHSERGSFSSSPRCSRAGSFNEDDIEGWAARSRLPSALSDRGEEPTGASEKAQRPGGEVHDGRARHSSASDAATAGAVGGGSQGSSRKRDCRRMSVHFANGDVYTGNCVFFEGGEKRHGLGKYTYSQGTHESYMQYEGQWRQDKKHGYGVLFYRNGGVYVGQWENNQKHGLGVLLDNPGDNDATQMPTYRYEGLWCEDEPNGLGAEECEASSYFGHFSRGKRVGRGVKMDLRKTNLEVMDVNGRCMPLLDGLEAEMQSAARSSRSPCSAPGREMLDSASPFHYGAAPEAQSRSARGSLPSRTPQNARRASPRGSLAQPVDGLPWAAHSAARTAARGSSENESGGSSEKNSGDTRSPMSARQNQMYRADLTTPSEGQDTPMPLGGLKARSPQHVPSLRSDEASPSETQSTPLVGAGASARLGAGAPYGGGRRDRMGGRTPSPEGPPISASPANTADWNPGGVDGSMRVEFRLFEENNLLSPPSTVGHHHPIPEEVPRQRDGGDSRPSASSASEQRPQEKAGDALDGEDAEARALDQEKRASRFPKVTVSDPWLPPGFEGDSPDAAAIKKATTELQVGGPAGGLAQGGLGLSGQCMNLDSSASPTVAGSKKDARQARPRRTPLLWSEEELGAFIACLGVSQSVSERVRERKLKGVVHLLEMSNSELRREFGLTSPVERLMVRQSLKRLLDADRWENSVRGHKVGDILSDSVLSKFIVPLEELTLVTKISQGGYGTVYRGVLEPSVERGMLQAHKSHLVAVKEMRGERRVRLYELLKEACVMASLNHANICTFIGVCANAAQRKHYIISELMDCSLFDLIHQPYKLRWHGELTVSLVISLSKAICAGIVYLHGRNLVHADLKSSNILIDYSTSWELIPRICDFGHAAVRTFPSPHHRCGTPHWAGPEVLRSEALGPAADIYSFGVIMWEMLAQKLPHKGLSFGQVLASVGWAGWTPDMSLLPEIPNELRRLLKECLSFSPADRPTSKDVQRRLHRIPKQARLKALQMLLAFLS